ncbi:MAG TPA: YoaK family protein [Burkholderiaceae bacterium]|nr:YoaK family protein [Burkholderiaceae bacterium]
MKLNLPTILSFNGGYVDTAGFLALQGLFTAHVTGNFVTLGAAIAHGSSGIIAKLLALPIFCVTIVIVLYAMRHISHSPRRSLLTMLVLKFVFLTAGAACAIHYGSFIDSDGWPLILTGALLIIAMAIQNAAHRIHLGSAPPSTLMTGTTTQIMIDLANLLRGASNEAPEVVKARLRRLTIAVVAFALGCGFAALFYIEFQMWCFIVPPLSALTGIAILMAENQGPQTD